MAESTAVAERSTTEEQLQLVFTPLQAHYLMRLLRLDAMRRNSSGSLDQAPMARRLLQRAIYSTWRDCSDQGVKDEAWSVLHAETARPSLS